MGVRPFIQGVDSNQAIQMQKKMQNVMMVVRHHQIPQILWKIDCTLTWRWLLLFFKKIWETEHLCSLLHRLKT